MKILKKLFILSLFFFINLFSQDNLLKSDIIIFSENSKKLKNLIGELGNQDQTGKIFVINSHENFDLDTNNSNITLIDKTKIEDKNFSTILKSIIEHPNIYITFINDANYQEKSLNLANIIKELESNKVYAFYLFYKNNLLQKLISQNFKNIIENTYLFEFEEYNLAPYIVTATYRKKELKDSVHVVLQNFLIIPEIEWKYFGWKKNCLLTMMDESK